MTDAELLALVLNMRVAQREYFRSRDRGALLRSKNLEAEVDKALRTRFSVQASLF